MRRATLALVAALLPSLARADCDTCAVELLGDTCTVSGLGSSAIGESTHAIGDYTFATGGHSEAWGRYSFAGGFDSSASGSVSFAFGDDAEASGVWSTAHGHHAYAEGEKAFAVGHTVTAYGHNSVAFGYESEAAGYASFVQGLYALASHNYSAAFGWGTTSGEENEFVAPKFMADDSVTTGTLYINSDDRNFDHAGEGEPSDDDDLYGELALADDGAPPRRRDRRRARAHARVLGSVRPRVRRERAALGRPRARRRAGASRS